MPRYKIVTTFEFRVECTTIPFRLVRALFNRTKETVRFLSGTEFEGKIQVSDTDGTIVHEL